MLLEQITHINCSKVQTVKSECAICTSNCIVRVEEEDERKKDKGGDATCKIPTIY